MRVGNSSAKTAAVNFIGSLLGYFIYPLSATLAPYPRLIIGFCTKMKMSADDRPLFPRQLAAQFSLAHPKLKTTSSEPED